MAWAASVLASEATAQSPSLTLPPEPLTIFHGDPATFRAAATGDGPLVYRWYRNGVLIPGATTNTCTLAAVSGADHLAEFSVSVSNALGAVTSAPVALTVDFGSPGAAVTNRVLHFNGVWRYDLSNNLDGVNWTAPAYNDSAWPSGPGLLAAENHALIAPLIGTTLLAPNAPPPGLAQGHACYFRAAVVAPTNNLIPGALVATLRADDGAMIYLNGVEALRLRLPAGAITNTSFTTGFPPDPSGGTDATADEVWTLNAPPLAPGTNFIAASVHQANSGSSDVVWGLALDVIGHERLRDTKAPVIAALLPSPDSMLPAFGSLEVHFSEPVKGVEAADLIVNGVPATNLLTVASDVYVFEFAPAPDGPVPVQWAAPPGIVDLSANSNGFAGGSYSYTVDPMVIAGYVRITEFMAGNDRTIRDEDGDYSDWIEIHNAWSQPVSLGNWYLTDNAANLTKWRFPAGLTLPADEYVLVWASDKNRKVLGAPLHTNFKLNKSAGNYLGLVYSDGLTVLSEFPNYPAQFDDVSYGRDRLDPSLVGYFTNATPGTANVVPAGDVIAPVQFSLRSGTFVAPFQLALTCASSNATIRYFIVTNAVSAALTNVPHSSSPVYTAPLTISGSVQVRARAFPATNNLFPSPPASETYLQITAGAAAFSSDLPIVLFHNFTGGTPPATADQSAVMMVFGTDYGRASLTNPPDLAVRIGLNIRGSTTQGFAKKSYAVEAWDEFNDDADVPVLGMLAESDWVFYAPNLFDKPWIHNPLLHDLSRAIGRYAPRARMIEVFNCFDADTVHYASPVVGHYNGIYVLEEKIKRDANRVNVSRLLPTDTNAPAISGGYVLKIDRADADERTFTAGNQTMVFVEPQMKDYSLYAGRAAQQNYIAAYFNSFYTALTSANWTNPATGYAAWIDTDAWVDHHLLNVLALNVDALRLSGHFFKDREKKIEMGPIWDFDRSQGTTAGNDWRAWNPRSWIASNPLGSATGTDFGTDFFNPAGMFANPWYSRLLQDPDFWQKWIDRYQTLRVAELSTNTIFALMDALTNQLAVAQNREITRWSDSVPRSGLVQPPAGWPDRTFSHLFPGSYAGEIAFLKRWFAERLNFMDTNFLSRPTFSRTGGLVSVGETLTVTPAAKTGSRLLFTLNGTDPRLPGGAISPAAFSNLTAVTLTLTNNVRVFARSWNPAHANLTGTRNPPISSFWSGPTVQTFYTALPPLRVTELMYHPPAPPAGNTNAADNFEFIELRNIGAAPLNLQGFRLSGGIEFTFPSFMLTGGRYVVVVKHLAAFQSRYGNDPLVAGVYTNNLDNRSDRVALHGPLQEPILDFTYDDTWYPATDGEGFSLVILNQLGATDSWNLKSSWRPSGALHGSPGFADPPRHLPAILVNEVLTHTTNPMQDAVELYNPTAGAVDLGGWFLTDNPHQPRKYRIPNGRYIAAGGFLTFSEDDFNVGPTSFAFSAAGESAYLFSGDANTNLTGYAHGFDFGAAPNAVSFGRYVDSLGREQFVLQSASTFGGRNAYPRVGPVVISEILFAPPPLPGGAPDYLNEFIELQNITATNVPLHDVNAPTNIWRLREAVDFDFPMNTVLPPGGRLLVVSFDPTIYGALTAGFVVRHGVPTNIPILGPWSGHLDDSSGTIALECPDTPSLTPGGLVVPYYRVEQVTYAAVPPWPGAAGNGASLQRLDPALFANDPLNWQTAWPTAGQANPAGPIVDADQDGLPDAWELANGLDPQTSGSLDGASGDPDGDGANNLHEYIAGTNPQDANDYLRFTSATFDGETRELQFPTKPGRTYAVEVTDDLASLPTWSALISHLPGTGSLFTVSDPQTTTRFYRLKVSFSPNPP